MAVALYPGTFDPVTNGHLDVLRRGAALFDRVIVAIGARIGKQTLLSQEERVAVFRECAAGLDNVSVEPFDGLQYGYAIEGASFVLWSSGPDGASGNDDDIEVRPGDLAR